MGAGRRLREVSWPAGLELPRLSWPSWARWARIFGEFSRSLARWARIFDEFSRSLARWARIFGEFSRISSSFGSSWRSHVWSKMMFQRRNENLRSVHYLLYLSHTSAPAAGDVARLSEEILERNVFDFKVWAGLGQDLLRSLVLKLGFGLAWARIF